MGKTRRGAATPPQTDIEVVRQAALILERENQRLVERNVDLTRRLLAAEGRDPAELQMEIARLEAQLAAARKRLFGVSSEKRPAKEAGPAPEREPQTGHGPREQHELPVVEVTRDSYLNVSFVPIFPV